MLSTSGHVVCRAILQSHIAEGLQHVQCRYAGLTCCTNGQGIMCTTECMTCQYKTLHCDREHCISSGSKYTCKQIQTRIDGMATVPASRSLHMFSSRDFVASLLIGDKDHGCHFHNLKKLGASVPNGLAACSSHMLHALLNSALPTLATAMHMRHWHGKELMSRISNALKSAV